MSNTDSSKWRRFSDYEIAVSDDGTKYVRPVPGSAPVIYDPLAKPDKLAVTVLNAAEDFIKDETDEDVILDLIRFTGPVGFEAASSDYIFPFGGESASSGDLALAGRGKEYGPVFSIDYAEKYDDICAWLKKLAPSCNCAPCGCASDECAPAPAAEKNCTSLKTMTEYCISALSAEQKLHCCANCGKIYVSDDPESNTCSYACSYQLELSDPNSYRVRSCCLFTGGG